MVQSSNSKWLIRGIVSGAVKVTKDGSCDAHEYATFTDVGKYFKWIDEKLRS